MDATSILAQHLQQYKGTIGKVVDIQPADCLLAIDFTSANPFLDANITGNPVAFSLWVDEKLRQTGCRYGVGGYFENRIIYAAREHFDNDDEPRSLHLGVDIWAAAGTPVYAPLHGIVHSFNNNLGYGDYGPTIILQHDIAGLTLYSLYGHLSSVNLHGLAIGQHINVNEQIGTFGSIDENGNWPPHLHFQLIFDLENLSGDYPGVCKPSEKEKYLQNIPNPALLLNLKYIL